MRDFRAFEPPRGTVQADWGELSADRKRYTPLDTVTLTIGPAQTGARAWRVEWYDGLGRSYGFAEGAFRDGPATVQYSIGGAPGMQFVRLWLDGAQHWCRLVNVYLAAETCLTTGDADLDAVYPMSRDSMLLNRRRYPLAEGHVVGYTTADSVQTLAYWLRDMYYNLAGYRLWEQDLGSGFAALFARQHEDGSLPDGVRADGSTWRMITESDVEYLAALALYETWLATGDDGWLRANLPAVERALDHLVRSPLRWDPKLRLVRRAHTCDTWDFSIYDGDRYAAETPKVASLCDQTGYFAALRAMAAIYRHLGEELKSLETGEEASIFRLAAAGRLWDGGKFQHHLHLDPFDHGDFDESRQLAMSNPWAITRGFAEPEQAVRIVETYRRRWQETGDRFPWWSLQPGYPHADYPFLANHRYQHTGGYCNGGLMPWVGGALCWAASLAGEEPFAIELMRDYAAFLQETDGQVFTWYWPNGEPGFRTANTTGHDGWAMGHWLAALFEGLAGIKVTGPAMRTVEVAPRWAAGDFTTVNCVMHLPAGECYTAYRWSRTAHGLDLLLTGVAERAEVRLLLPEGQAPHEVRVDLRPVSSKLLTVGLSRYVVLQVEGRGVTRIEVDL